MKHELKATRYLTPRNQPLARFIVNELHGLDYAETLRFYSEVLPHIDHMGRALLGANDRYFLMVALMRRIDALHPWLFARCREVEAEPHGYLDLWARFHFKSSFITIGGTIQDIIVDQESTTCILSNVKSLARAFVAQIQKELEDNDNLKTLYSDVFWQNPKRQAPRWSIEAGLVVKRNSNQKEGTVEGHGLVDGMPTGFHYDHLCFDDIVTDKSITPIATIKTTLQLENADNLGKPGGTTKRMAGTRWSFGDTYGQIADDRRVKVRIYPATKDGTLKGTPVFLTPKRWADIKKAQKRTVSAQMLLNPVQGSDAVFHSTWFRPYDVYPSVMNVYILVDPSKGKKKHQYDTRPDRTAIVVIGIDPLDNRYLLDGFCHRMRFTERYGHIKSLRDKWSAHRGVQLVRVGYERYGAQIDTEVIEDMQDRDKEWFEVVELNTPRQGPENKNSRIERLEPDLREGRWHMPSIVYHPDFGGPNGMCLWSIWSEDDQRQWTENAIEELSDKARAEHGPELDIKEWLLNNPPISPHDVGQTLFRPIKGLTRAQRFQSEVGQHNRVVKAIRRIDEDKNIYDLTLVCMDELRLHPFAKHDDLIDAASRLYDMDPVKPEVYEVQAGPEAIDPEDLSYENYDA